MRKKYHDETPAFDVSKLESDISESLRGWSNSDHKQYAPLAIREAEQQAEQQRTPVPLLPELAEGYVQPQPAQVTTAAYQAGDISEAAIAIQFEAVAKEVEAMGTVMKQTAKQAELMMNDVTAALQYVGEIAEKYRSGGKVLYSRLEQVSALAESVKATCEELKKHIKEDV